MEELYSKLLNSKLFAGLDVLDIPHVLKCLDMQIKHYEKNTYIYRFNDFLINIGLVLNGEVLITREDYWGNDAIIANITSSQIFGESFVTTNKPLLVNIKTKDKCSIMFLNMKNIIKREQGLCRYHVTLIHNFISILSEKNIMLNQKINCISQRSTSEKLMAYLSDIAKIMDKTEFDIPFNRQQLADYLAVDRSALSTEISLLKRMGVIKSNKNHFELLNKGV